jgi:hypothetical protein
MMTLFQLPPHYLRRVFISFRDAEDTLMPFDAIMMPSSLLRAFHAAVRLPLILMPLSPY